MSLTFHEIAELMRMVEAGSCRELVFESEGMKLIIRGGCASGEGSAGTVEGAAPDARTDPPELSIEGAGVPADGAVGPAPVARPDGKVEVRAPIVGTFYRAPSPEAAPFVEVRSEVEAGDPLGLIEVMKLFTTVEARVSGRVAEIAAANGELVEYDALLFVIEPS